MPKLKTKSSAKKRFKISAKGRGTTTMSKQDGKIVKSYMPYSLRG